MDLKKIEDALPYMLSVDGIEYKLSIHLLHSHDTVRISYGEFDGNFFNWNNKPIDLFYEIVDTIPPVIEYNAFGLQSGTIYKLSVSDVISDCFTVLEKWHNGNYTVLDEIVTTETKFYRELTSLLNRYGKDSECNIPDYKLSSYLCGCIHNLKSVTNSKCEGDEVL